VKSHSLLLLYAHFLDSENLNRDVNLPFALLRPLFVLSEDLVSKRQKCVNGIMSDRGRNEGIPVMRSMMKILKWTVSTCAFLLLTISILGISAFGAVNPEAYVNRTHGFSINPPSGWTVNDTGVSPPIVVFFYGPVIPETGGKININIAAGTATASLDEYVSGVKQWCALNFTNFNVVSEGHRNVSRLDCYELVVTWTYMPGANVSNTHTFNIKQKLVLFVEKGKAYNIAFTASPANYDEYLPVFEESLQTFKLLGPEFPWQTILNIIIGAIVGAGAGVIISVAFLIKRRKAKTQQQRIVSQILELLKLSGSIKIDDLAKRFATTEADIELAVIQLKRDGVPVSFNRETREVTYEKQE